MMKKILFPFVLLLTITIGLVSCDSNSSKATAEKFLNNFYHMDYKEAKTVSTEDTKKALDMIEQFSTFIPDSQKVAAKKIKVEIKKVEENGNKATVYYVTSDNKSDQKIDLVKENDKWLVKFSKQNTMGADANMNEPSEETPSADTPTAPPADGTINQRAVEDSAMNSK